jgi:glycosyltransferase involved in cell wall biosynthesis
MTLALNATDRHPREQIHLPSFEIFSTEECELSVVIPCLNESETLGVCIRKAQEAMHAHGIDGEVVVADNGSTDDSRQIAREHGARVVVVEEKGYGSALMGGIKAARGRFLLMGDADDSYDFGELPKFVEKLRAGYDLVQGCRLPSGGGSVRPGAMPILHRWWGNPMFSWMARTWFGAPIHDVHCGMRGFTRDLYGRIGQVCSGMEFASENIIKASLGGARIAEVPITLHPDGRTKHPPHLRTFRDGWRHLRFYLLYSPRWLFLIPGLVLVAIGLLGYAVAMPAVQIGGIQFDVHTLLIGSLFIICGYQSVLFAVFTKVFAITQELLPADQRITRLLTMIRLETGLIAGALLALTGVVLIGWSVGEWWMRGFGPLDYSHTMRLVIPGVMFTILGVQTLLSSFFLSILGLQRR